MQLARWIRRGVRFFGDFRILCVLVTSIFCSTGVIREQYIRSLYFYVMSCRNDVLSPPVTVISMQAISSICSSTFGRKKEELVRCARQYLD